MQLFIQNQLIEFVENKFFLSIYELSMWLWQLERNFVSKFNY